MESVGGGGGDERCVQDAEGEQCRKTHDHEACVHEGAGAKRVRHGNKFIKVSWIPAPRLRGDKLRGNDRSGGGNDSRTFLN